MKSINTMDQESLTNRVVELSHINADFLLVISW